MFNFIETPNTASKAIDSITITANEHLSFPTFFVDKHKLKGIGELLYTRLYFDAESRAMAIQFTPHKTDGSYKVNVSPQYGATCKIKSFLLINDLPVNSVAKKYGYKKYTAEQSGIPGEDVFVIELDRPLGSSPHTTPATTQGESHAAT